MKETNPVRVLLDTSYLLPLFRVEVRGLDDRDLGAIGRLVKEGVVEPYAASIQLVEIAGKLARIALKEGIPLEELLGILESGYEELASEVNILHPDKHIIKLATRLRYEGHKDMFDNILYATAIHNSMLLLTMDKEFRDFLARKGHRIDIILDHKTLMKRLRREHA